jgi:hypothetical protein
MFDDHGAGDHIHRAGQGGGQVIALDDRIMPGPDVVGVQFPVGSTGNGIEVEGAA